MNGWREVWRDDYRREAQQLQETRKAQPKPKPKPKLTLTRKAR